MRKDGYNVMSKDHVNDDLAQRQTFATGSERQALIEVRYDLISPIALKRLAQTYAEGARKYTDRNWEKGQPFGVLLNHARDHINDFIAQQLDLGEELGISREDHLSHAVWNLFAIMHFQTTKPEMNDLRQSSKPGLVTAGKIDTSAISATKIVNMHAFQGHSKGLCEVCREPREHKTHYQGTERSTEGE